MASRAEKREQVEEIKGVMTGAELWIVSDFRGLAVTEMHDLRRKINESGGQFGVTKNSLARRAAAEAGLEAAIPLFEGPSAITECHDDLVGPAKALWDLFQRDDRWVIRGGVLNGELISVDQVQKLASLPGMEQMLAQVVGGIEGPLSGLVWTLDGVLSGLVYALQGRLDQLQESNA